MFHGTLRFLDILKLQGHQWVKRIGEWWLGTPGDPSLILPSLPPEQPRLRLFTHGASMAAFLENHLTCVPPPRSFYTRVHGVPERGSKLVTVTQGVAEVSFLII